MKENALIELLAAAEEAEKQVRLAEKAVDDAKTNLNRVQVTAMNAWIEARKAFEKNGLLDKLNRAK